MFSLSARTAARTVAAAPSRLGAVRSVGGLGSNMHDNDPHTIETEKQKNLSGKQESTIKHAPGWNERLASASEASVKADRADVDPSTLQAETVSAIKSRHHAGETVAAHEETKTTINTNGSATVETVSDVIKS